MNAASANQKYNSAVRGGNGGQTKFTYAEINAILKNKVVQPLSELDSFVLLLPVEGNFSLEWENGSVFVTTGEVVLIPNVIEKVNIRTTNAKILEVYNN